MFPLHLTEITLIYRSTNSLRSRNHSLSLLLLAAHHIGVIAIKVFGFPVSKRFIMIASCNNCFTLAPVADMHRQASLLCVSKCRTIF